MAFDLSGYQTVQERIDLLWEIHPNARYNIEIVSLTETQVVMKCSLWTDASDEHPRTVDFAEERVGTTNVNKVSHIENCATSVLGRCISGLGGVFSPKGKRPSREEMQKVERHSKPAVKPASAPGDLSNQLAMITTAEGLQKLYEDARAGGWWSDDVAKLFSERKSALK